MATPLAYEGLTLAHGDAIVRLRPSLRAAQRLERLHDGFPALHRHLADFHLGTITSALLALAVCEREARQFLASVATLPLVRLHDLVMVPLLQLVAGLIPPSSPDAKRASASKALSWGEAFEQLFRYGTGWLGWTPEATWNATPAEILAALDGHVAKLRALHGAPDDNDPAGQNGDVYTPERLKQIEQQGHDPAFDRAALAGLKAQIANGS